jgi:hypothetical protein
MTTELESNHGFDHLIRDAHERDGLPVGVLDSPAS